VILAFERLNKSELKPIDNQAVDYFMKQSGSLDNACGVIACLHSIFNIN